MTEPHNTKWLSYQQASQWAQSQNIMTRDQWTERCATGLLEGVPADPEVAYGDEFFGWDGFLGVQPARNGSKMFWNYERAQKWAQQQGIKSGEQWKKKSKEGGLPAGVPAQPYKVYKDHFKDWGDFLGTYHFNNKDKPFVTYEEAMEWAKTNKITSMLQWKSKRKDIGNERIPAHPNRVYKEFTIWGEFLGTGRVANKDREFLSYEEASAWAQEEGIFSSEDWFYRSKLGFPLNIPMSPSDFYGKSFRWHKFLNYKGKNYTGRRIYDKENTWSYLDVLNWARDKGICSGTEWQRLCKEGVPPGIPSCPHKIYPEFVSWSDFLGLAKVHGMSRIERMMRYVVEHIFEDRYTDFAQPIITDDNGKRHRVDICLPRYNLIIEYDGGYWHQNKENVDKVKTEALINSQNLWHVIRLRGEPLSLIREEWDISIDETSPASVQIHALLQHLIKLSENGKINLPKDLIEEIQQWSIEKISKINFREVLKDFDNYKSYDESVQWAKENHIKSSNQWKRMVKELTPDGIPLNPSAIYQEFKDWGDFLGTGRISLKNRSFLSYEEISAWAQREGIQSVSQWKLRCKKGVPKNIPTNPDISYPQEFKDNNGWWGFFGKPKPLKKVRK